VRDSIDDLDVIRSGGMKLFGGVYACATLGIFLREFTYGHVRQLGAVLRRFLVALAERIPLLPGITDRAYIDIDSLLRPVYGKAKQGASFGHTKIQGRPILRRGLSRLAVTISTDKAAPVLAGVRLRAGRAGSSKGAASMLTEAINTAVEAGAQPRSILVRGDSAYCGGKIIAAVVKAGATFSFAIARNSAVDAVRAGALPGCSDRSRHRRTDLRCSSVRIGVHRIRRRETVQDHRPARCAASARRQHPGPAVPGLTPSPVLHSTEPVAQADVTHREHAIVETVWSDLIDAPWAHQPSGSFPANAAWAVLAAITHNLLRAAGTLTEVARHAVARGATLRTHLVNVAAHLARPQRRPVLHLPSHWPRADAWLAF
jgi:hypothetical protein